VGNGLGGGEHLLASDELPGDGGARLDFVFEFPTALRDELFYVFGAGELEASERPGGHGEEQARDEDRPGLWRVEGVRVRAEFGRALGERVEPDGSGDGEHREGEAVWGEEPPAERGVTERS